MSRRICIISPCRDEAEYLAKTLDSVIAQSLQPALWVIVDDGSTDATPEMLASYAAAHDWIRIVRVDDRGHRLVGPGVIDAFYKGLAEVDLDAFDYVCKLDLDLGLPPLYFERLVERMESEPRLGTFSGKPYFPGPDGTLISEACGDEMSVGMTKFYRVECFRQIGGFVREVMWDGIDCHRCRMLGWIAGSEDDPDLQFIHYRPMGSSHQSMWTGRLRWGRGQYFMGTSLPYVLVSAAFRMTRRPFITGGLCIAVGYIDSALHRRARYGDLEFRQFLRRYQWQCLLKGKRHATEHVNAQRYGRWQSTTSHSPRPLGQVTIA